MSSVRLLASVVPAAATAAVAAAPGGDDGDQEGVLLNWLVDGGNQVGFLAVHGPQLVGFGDEEPQALVVVFSQHDPKLRR